MDAVVTLALAGAAAVNSAAPGPCIVVVGSRAVTEGLSSGLRVTLGIAASKALLLAGAWSMMLGLLTVTEQAQAVLRIGGLVLLSALAVAMLRAPRSAPTAPAVKPGARVVRRALARLRPGDAALGLGLGLSSPLNLLFMFALLPQVVDVAALSPRCIATASAAVLLGGALPFLATAMFAARVPAPDPRRAQWITRCCGGALLAFAAAALVAGR